MEQTEWYAPEGYPEHVMIPHKHLLWILENRLRWINWAKALKKAGLWKEKTNARSGTY